MPIIVLFHASGDRNFKDYDTQPLLKYEWRDFPTLVSYNRFVELMPAALIPLAAYLQTRFGYCGRPARDCTALTPSVTV
ncbi:MAG: hypothetical protein M3R15_34475 [Acidobacteriota bacterium]|nr:hypothetical protein [Acidobacteriota bacterium]